MVHGIMWHGEIGGLGVMGGFCGYFGIHWKMHATWQNGLPHKTQTKFSVKTEHHMHSVWPMENSKTEECIHF